TALEAKRSAFLLRRAEIESYVQALEAGRRKGQEGLLVLASEWVSKLEFDAARTKSLTLPDQLYALLIEEQKLLESRGAKHPEVEAVRKRIELAREFFSTPGGAWQKATPSGDKERPAVDPVESHLQFFKQQLDHLDIAEELLGKLYDKEYAKARELTA